MPHPYPFLDPTIHPPLGTPRPPRTRRRQILTACLLLFLVAIIVAYWAMTDPKRLGPMAEHYLSKIVGSHVKVRSAYLSLFDGLRLEGVQLFVGNNDRPDSLLLSARAFLVRASIPGLLSGRMDAAQILALDPHLQLCENFDADPSARWNYSLLAPPKQTEQPHAPDRAISLPKIVLRGGVVQYSRIINGRHELVGSMAVDGQLIPASLINRPNRYRFELDGRAKGHPAGPRISGIIDMDTPSFSANIQTIEFDNAVRAMLPTQVQTWWQAHQLAGRVRIPRIEYVPEYRGASRSFNVEVQLDGVNMAILPEELLGSREFHRIASMRPGIRIDEPADLGLVSRAGIVDRTLQLRPLFLKNVSGRLVFSPDRVRICGLSGQIETNTVLLYGEILGYNEDAPASLRLIANNMLIPPHPRYLPSLPQVIRKVYSDFSPAGRASLFFDLTRHKPGDTLKIQGEALILDGAFCFDEFLYPLRRITGSIIVGPDRATGQDRLDLVNLRCLGLEGTKNANAHITINGWVSPIDRGSAVEVQLASPSVSFDEHIRRALPDDARSVMDLFDIRSRGDSNHNKILAPVELSGAFAARIRRPPGPKRNVSVDVNLDIAHGNGQFQAFPYPLRNVSGKISIHPRYTEIKNLVAKHHDASISLDGRVSYGPNRPTEPSLSVIARNIPLDDDLFLALRHQQRQWLLKGGLTGGFLDIDGSIYLPPNAASASDTDFQLDLIMRDANIWPVNNTFALTNANAKLQLSSTSLRIHQLTAKRANGQFVGHGVISWPDDQPRFNVAAVATNLPLDQTLFNLLPANAQQWWKLLRPQGTTDLDIAYTGNVAQEPDSNQQNPPSAENYRVIIRPRQLAINPAPCPWPVDKVTGSVLVTPDKTSLHDVLLHRGSARIKLNGSGNNGPDSSWILSASGHDIPVDDHFRRAIGTNLRAFCDSIKLAGSLAFDVPALTIRPQEYSPSASHPPATPPLNEIQIQNATLSLTNGSLDTGLPLTHINGGLRELAAVIRGSTIQSFSANILVPSMQLAQRPATDFRGSVKKTAWPATPNHSVYHFQDMQAKVAGGQIAISQLDIDLPDKGPSAYTLRLDMKDIDLRSLQLEDNITGRLNASLNLEAKWDNPASRVGRGDVLIQGKELYNVPVVFGWLQIANLAMPGKSPFTEASCTYNIQGQRLVLRPIVLRSSTVTMQGDGVLDFASKRLEMTFLTDNRNLFRIPIIGDLIDVAKHELLPIRVTGTIHEPQVRVQSLRTFTTTLDQVFRTDQKNPKSKKK